MAKSSAQENQHVKRDREGQKNRQRELQREAVVKREQARRKRLLTRIGFAAIAVVAVAVAILFSLKSSGGSGGEIAVAASLGPQTSAAPSSPTGQFSPAGPIVRQNGKPELLFIGALYCPYCAAERWSLVKSLSQFGTFSGLKSTVNTRGEAGYGVIPTFDLTHAAYRSKYVSLVAKDTEDRAHNPLQTLSSSQQNLFNRYDSMGSIPLVLVGGYSEVGSGYSPGLIDGKSFTSVQHSLQSNRGGGYAQSINAEANVITALLCHADRSQPASACHRSEIRSILSHLH